MITLKIVEKFGDKVNLHIVIYILIVLLGASRFKFILIDSFKLFSLYLYISEKLIFFPTGVLKSYKVVPTMYLNSGFIIGISSFISLSFTSSSYK